MSLRRNADRPFGKFLVGRLERLYVPFVVWSLIYLLARDIERLLVRHLPPVRPRFTMLWTGTEYHLWFLPFLLGWTIVLAVVYRGLILRDRRWRWFIIAAAVTAALIIGRQPAPHLPPATEMTFDDPVATTWQWLQSTPAAFGALAFAVFVAMGPTVWSVPVALGWAGMGLLVGCCLKQAIYGIALTPRALTGLGSMLVALAPWKTNLIPAFARIGRKGYGIYLCHVFPVEIIHIITRHLHLPRSGWVDVANFSLSFLGAWGLVVLLEKSPRTAWLNG